MSTTITAEQAAREIARRGKSKAQKAKGRPQAIADGTFGLTGPVLESIAKRAQAQVKAQKPKAPKAPVEAPVCPVKAGAKAAFEAAFEAAEDGQRQKAGRKAYGEYRRAIEALAG